jgi:hypothetical protein
MSPSRTPAINDHGDPNGWTPPDERDRDADQGRGRDEPGRGRPAQRRHELADPPEVQCEAGHVEDEQPRQVLGGGEVREDRDQHESR